MTSWEYAAALGAILLGTLALRAALRLPYLHGWRLAKTLLVVGFLFTLWDVIAVSRGHWNFNLSKTFGILVANQPVEEVAFLFTIPLFYLTVWQMMQPANKKESKK